MTPLVRTLLVALVVIVLDRGLKIWIVDGLDLKNRLRIDVVDPWLNLAMAWNQGVNFGLLNFGGSGRWVLVAVAVAISAALLVWVRRVRGWAMPLATGLIVGGALGNAWDRMIWGAVADFINMSCCGIRNPYAFNLADIAIFAGAFALILVSEPRKKTRDKA